jgi:hypothetical protein
VENRTDEIVVSEAERRDSRGATVNEILRCLGRLSLAEFGELLLPLQTIVYMTLR